MSVSVNTKLMAVIGDPIEHSLSPLMHNNIIERHGLNGVYFPFLIHEEGLKQFTESVRLLNIAGFNATMPHKQALISLMDEVEPEALLYNSINTVKNVNGKLIGYNTDVKGLVLAFQGRGIDLKDKEILIIGAGGVAGSLVAGGKAEGVRHITVLNRTKEKAVELCKNFTYAEGGPLTIENLKHYGNTADIIINCTSLGMSGVEADFEDLSFLDNTAALLCDLIYNPWETNFLTYGRERGLETMNGIDMLIYQGILAFEIFADVNLNYHQERQALFPICEAKLRGV